MPKLTVHDGGKWGEDLSARQRAILDMIREWIDGRGVPPTYREIGQAMGIRSTNGVSDHVKALMRKGYLTRLGDGDRSLARSLILTEKALAVPVEGGEGEAPEGMTDVPLFGRVAAGEPILAEENRMGTVRVDAALLPRGGKTFALRVSGESMIDDGIFDGDYIFVRKQLEVLDGDISVVMVDGEATVKRLFREAGGVRLQPANPSMEPIYLPASEFTAVDVLGIVVGVYRKLH